jgi:hypothetical protein
MGGLAVGESYNSPSQREEANMTNRTRLVLGVAGVLVVFFGVLRLSMRDTYQIVPGGPKLAPDLTVESIQFKTSTATVNPCTSYTPTFDVTVTIRNAGTKTADLPLWKNWVVIWSVVGGTAPPFKVWVAGPPAQLAPGQTATLTEKVAAMINVLPDKKTSGIGFGVIVDPDQVIPESNEDNNFKNSVVDYGCVPP